MKKPYHTTKTPFPRSALGNERNMVWYGFWSKLGRILYWVTLPGIRLTVRLSLPRTRIFVEYQGHILLVKDWLGDGTWKLPGGGLHKGEEPLQGVIRELAEETGVNVKAEQVKPIGTFSPKTDDVAAEIHAFYVILNTRPTVAKQTGEIIDLCWLNVGSFDEAKLSRTTKTLVAALSKVKKLV